DYSKGPHEFEEQFIESSQDVRRPIRVLNYRVVMLQMEGQRNQALQTCMTMFRLIRHLERRPLFVSFLVGLAVRGVAVHATHALLRSGPFPPAAYDSLNAELARRDLIAAQQRALQTERAFGIDEFAELGPLSGYMRLPYGKQDQLSYLEVFEVAIHNAARPYGDAQARTDIQQVLDRSGPLTKSVGPALNGMNTAMARCEAQMRSLRVLSAILLREQAGELGELKLADLGLPNE